MLKCILTPGLLEFLVPPLLLCLVAFWSSRARSSILLPLLLSVLTAAALVTPNLFDNAAMTATDVLGWIVFPVAGMTGSLFAAWLVGRRAMAREVTVGRAWTLAFAAGAVIALVVGVYMYAVSCMIEGIAELGMTP